MNAPFALLALDGSSMWIKGATVAAFFVLSYALAMWVAMVAWTYRDATARTADPWVRWGSAALVGVANVPGLLMYLVLRPGELMVENYNRQLEAEAFLREVAKDTGCTACRRSVDADFAYCPHCRAQLQTPCTVCARLMRSSWTMCAYCAHPREVEPLPASLPDVAPRYARPVAAAAPKARRRAVRVSAVSGDVDAGQSITEPVGVSGG